VLLAWDHLQLRATLWETDFGRTLAVKLAVFGLVVALGLANWRRLGPEIERGETSGWLRRSASLEAVLAAVLILGLTAWLGGLSIPARH
jgi:putative copper export protein